MQTSSPSYLMLLVEKMSREAVLLWPVFNRSGHEPRDDGPALTVNKAKDLWIENPSQLSPLNRPFESWDYRFSFTPAAPRLDN